MSYRGLSMPGGDDLGCRTPKRITLDEMYMRMAEVMATRSSAVKRKVGCLIVADKRFITGAGYNGTDREDNICEGPDGKTLDDVVHAEVNALKHDRQSGLAYNELNLYVTWSPCRNCAEEILQHQDPINKIYYRNLHKTDGIALLKEHGIECTQLLPMV